MARKFYYNERNARELLREALHVIISGEETHYLAKMNSDYRENNRKVTGIVSALFGEQIREIMDIIYPGLSDSERGDINTIFRVAENDERPGSWKLPLKRVLGASAIFASELEDLILENKLESLIDIDSL